MGEKMNTGTLLTIWIVGGFFIFVVWGVYKIYQQDKELNKRRNDFFAKQGYTDKAEIEIIRACPSCFRLFHGPNGYEPIKCPGCIAKEKGWIVE